MALALGFAAVVGFFAFLERPQQVAAKASGEEATGQNLVRSDPDVKPWQEKEITAPEESNAPEESSTLQPEADGSALRCRRTGIPSRHSGRSPPPSSPAATIFR